MEHYPRIKFMLSDYVVVKVKDGKIIEIYVDKAKSERHSIQLQKDSTGIVRYTEGEAYDIRIIK